MFLLFVTHSGESGRRRMPTYVQTSKYNTTESHQINPDFWHQKLEELSDRAAQNRTGCHWEHPVCSKHLAWSFHKSGLFSSKMIYCVLQANQVANQQSTSHSKGEDGNSKLSNQWPKILQPASAKLETKGVFYFLFLWGP